MTHTPSPGGPRYPLRLAIPINSGIEERLIEQAEAESIPKTTLARKLLVEGLRGLKAVEVKA
jgi:hypothetical protein